MYLLYSSAAFLSVPETWAGLAGVGARALFCRSSDYLTSNGHLSEDEARKKFWQILSAVEYCHSHHIVHRDLKTENLLLDGNMDIKLAGRGSRCTQEVPSWWGGAAACALCTHTCEATAPAVCTVTSSPVSLSLRLWIWEFL